MTVNPSTPIKPALLTFACSDVQLRKALLSAPAVVSAVSLISPKAKSTPVALKPVAFDNPPLTPINALTSLAPMVNKRVSTVLVDLSGLKVLIC